MMTSISFKPLMLMSALVFLGLSAASAHDTTALSDQRMADSPEALIKSLGAVSFLTPEEMAQKRAQELSGLLHPFDIPQSPQLLDPRFDPRASIQAADISEYLDHLTGISINRRTTET